MNTPPPRPIPQQPQSEEWQPITCISPLRPSLVFFVQCFDRYSNIWFLSVCLTKIGQRSEGLCAKHSYRMLICKFLLKSVLLHFFRSHASHHVCRVGGSGCLMDCSCTWPMMYKSTYSRSWTESKPASRQFLNPICSNWLLWLKSFCQHVWRGLALSFLKSIKHFPWDIGLLS